MDVAGFISRQRVDVGVMIAAAAVRRVNPVDEVDLYRAPMEFAQMCHRTRELGGHVVISEMRWALKNMGLAFTEAQRRYHELLFPAILPLAFGREWDENREEIMRKYGYTTMCQRVAFSMPRSNGKTVSTAAFLAAMMYAFCFRPLEIVCFAIGERQTKMMVARVAEYLWVLVRAQGAKKFFFDRTTNSCAASLTNRANDPNTATLCAMPGTAEAGRGKQPHVVVLDEAAYINQECMRQTIVPMFGHRERAVFAISTPGYSDGFFESFFNARLSDGTPVFVTTRIENICSACATAGLTTCEHLISVTPPWKDELQMEVMRVLYQGDPEAFNREAAGVMGTLDVPAFEPDLVMRLFSRNVSHSQAVPFFFLSIDPAAGGKSSDTAWTSSFVTDDAKMVVRTRALCGCERRGEDGMGGGAGG
jgi:hypothetical protein